MHGGFRLYSDDLAVLGRSDGRAEIAGLPRSLKVHSRTAELLPWLAPLLGDAWDANGEQPLSLDQARAFAEIAAEPVPLAAILRLAGRSDGDHVLRPIPDMEALMHLCEEKLRGGQLGMPDFQRQTFRRLGAALAGVPAYELRVGRDLAGVPARVESAVAQAAASRSSGARR
jgi:hypothetical protein